MGVSSNTILDYNLVRFEVCMIKLRHERMLILRCTLQWRSEGNWRPGAKLKFGGGAFNVGQLSLLIKVCYDQGHI